ncbi:hypothetical protein PILCRDRAFT_12391 [Piloderma croceum F 1598]|uniref:Uncharacterized protein n=1 Tax=Piloderma croceum (strain F 1598) TaxID=765440 RepID=A0A0C3FBF8_PILCF|nr:hypothetical protein PILCRDRAFT_12391 [Piloderma croceum F 1598]
MNIIHQCLSLAPIPYLAPAFSILRFICSPIEQAQASKQQLRALAQTIAQLLCMLNEEYRAGRLVRAKTSTSVANLDRFVSLTVSLTLLFTKGHGIAQIDQYRGLHWLTPTEATDINVGQLFMPGRRGMTMHERLISEHWMNAWLVFETNQQQLMQAFRCASTELSGHDGLA